MSRTEDGGTPRLWKFLMRHKLVVIPAVILVVAVVTVVLLTEGEHDAPFVYSIR